MQARKKSRKKTLNCNWYVDTFVAFKFYYTYYSGSETRSRAFITSSSRVSGIKPLSEEEAKLLISKRYKMLSRSTNFTQKYKYSIFLKFANKWWGSRRNIVFKRFSPTLKNEDCNGETGFIIHALISLILAKNSISL